MSIWLDSDVVNQNIGAPRCIETGLLAFQISDKILAWLKKNGYVHQQCSVGLGGIIMEECEEIRAIGVREGLALAQCDNVCRALFGLD